MSEVVAAMAAAESVKEVMGVVDKKKASTTYSCCFPHDDGSEEAEKGQVPLPVPADDKIIKFPFQLDSFQEMAIACLHRGQSVVVSAHTSAGKTVVAQYAIAQAVKRDQRVIYTTPIKALSNQKFRDLGESMAESGFKDAGIGLMTGDVTVNPEASCLVMTTEILRSMLYHGSSELSEVSCVVFDEVHYLRDKERGVVWEESIVLLPPEIKLVFLSATVPNAREFAQWVADLKDLPCHVISTDFRPTPLQHYMFPAGGNGLYLVMDGEGQMLEDNFEALMANQQEEGGERKKRGGNEPSDIIKVVSCVVEEGLQPAIVFSFSRRDCEGLAQYLDRVAKFELTDDNEKTNVQKIVDSALATLSDADQKLPQIQMLVPLLLSGIGIHHSGLLPVLREIIEILFQEGLLKVLFATETFALGLNMPAKTCVFSSCSKFDGQERRWISPCEYIQMAGRAGRRGIDDRGVVITMLDKQMEAGTAREIIRGQLATLSSTFHLSYNMLLNATRTSGVDPESIISKSFHQFQQNSRLPSLKYRLKALQRELNKTVGAEDKEMVAEAEEYSELRELHRQVSDDMTRILQRPAAICPYLIPGRLVHILEGTNDWGWGVLLRYYSREPKGTASASGGGGDDEANSVVLDVLLPTRETHTRSSETGSDGAGGSSSSHAHQRAKGLSPCEWRAWSAEAAAIGYSKWKPRVLPVLLSTLKNVSTVRLYLNNVEDNVGDERGQRDLLSTVYRAMSQFDTETASACLPALAQSADMAVRVPELKGLQEKMRVLNGRLKAHAWDAVHQRLDLQQLRSAAGIGMQNGGGKKKRRRGEGRVGGAGEGGSGAKKGRVEAGKEEVIVIDEGREEEEGEVTIEEEGEVKKEEPKAEEDEDEDEDEAEMQKKLAVLVTCQRRAALQAEIAKLQRKNKSGAAGAHSFKEELKARLRVLRKLKYVTEEGTITIKGRLACEVEISDDLVVVEMLLKGAFNKAPVADVAAILSCQIVEEKNPSVIKQEERLREELRIMKECKEEVSAAEVEFGLRQPDTADAINTGMMDILHMWCSGAEFGEICAQSDMFEGSIIRVMRRMSELLKQLELGAAAIGDKDLEEKFKAVTAAMCRGVPFSSSLYV